MPLSIDPEIAAAMRALAGSGSPAAPLVGDVLTRRRGSAAFNSVMGSRFPRPDGVSYTAHVATAHDGAEIALRWYTKAGAQPGSAALFIHGGGMIAGSMSSSDPFVARYVGASGVPLLVVEYRLAPEHPHPTPVEDSYAALVWLSAHARELGVEPARIGVFGESAGAGLAVGVALLARDRHGPPIAKQILVYPMLDDRNVVPDAALSPHATWTYDDNLTGWRALLGEAHGEVVSPYAAPARATDVSGLPSTYLELGDLDIFRDEDLAFAHALMRAAVPVELHVHAGAPHGFTTVAPDAAVTQRALADRHRALQSL